MTLLILFDGGEAALPVSDINVLTKKSIRVQFTDEIVTDSRYYDVNNYSIAVVEGTGPVEVLSVLPTNETASLELILVTQPMTHGTTYSLTIDEFVDRSGNEFSLVGGFIYRDTKSDSALRSIPRHFDNRPASIIAAFVTAISINDDIIGGSRSDTLVVESA
jgi:hypothetical protein